MIFQVHAKTLNVLFIVKSKQISCSLGGTNKNRGWTNRWDLHKKGNRNNNRGEGGGHTESRRWGAGGDHTEVEQRPTEIFHNYSATQTNKVIFGRSLPELDSFVRYIR